MLPDGFVRHDNTRRHRSTDRSAAAASFLLSSAPGGAYLSTSAHLEQRERPERPRERRRVGLPPRALRGVELEQLPRAHLAR